MRVAAVGLLVLGACELVVGADFDEKTLVDPPGAGTGGAGGQGRELGAPCASPAECQSGFCADGVCCESACEGECVDCAIGAGHCAPLAAATSCSGGRCDGSGTCATGVTRWAKRFGDGDLEEATSCAFDSQGALLVAGRFQGSIDIDGEVSSQTALATGPWIYLAKLDADGVRQWTLALGAEGDVDVTSMAVDAAGGPAIVGTFQGIIDVGGRQLTSPSERAGYVIKLDAAGAHEWHAMFTGTVLSRNGSVPDFLLQHVALGDSGEAYVTGAYLTSAMLGSTQLTPGGTAGIYVARIDPGGTVRWARTSTTDPGGLVAPRGIAARPGGGAFVGGHFDVTDVWFGSLPKLVHNKFMGDGGHDPFVVAYDGEGNELWARDHGVDAASQLIESVAIDPLGNLLLAGSFGGLLNFGGGNLFHPSGDSGGSLAVDVFLAKLSGEADYRWDRSYGAFHALAVLEARVAADGHGNVVLAGNQANATVDFGLGELAPATHGWFVTKTSGENEPLWARAFGTQGSSSTAPIHHWLWDVAGDGSGAVAFCGFAVETVDYGTGALAKTSDAPDAMVAVLEP